MKERTPTDSVSRRQAIRVLHGLILLALIAAVFLLLNRDAFSGYALPQFAGSRDYAESHWVYKQGDKVLEDQITPPAFRHMSTGKTYSISTELTYDGSGDRNPSCFFFVDHMYCRALLDGEVLFSYMPEDVQRQDRGRSPGNVYASFQLPRDCRGKELTIEFVPALSDSIDYQLPNPVFGNYLTQLVHLFWNDLPHNLVVVFAGILGLASILFSTLALPGFKYREGMFIGAFAILFCLYNITESDFDFYMISNPYYTYLLDYITFSLMPILLMCFLRERMDPWQKPIGLVMILLSAAMFGCELLLHFTGRSDMREFLPLLHTVYFVAFLLIYFMLLTMKKNKWKTQLILQMIPILIGVVLDASVYYFHWQLGSSDATFTSIGVIIFLATELYHVWKYSVEVYTESRRSQDYWQMAYVDPLTGVGNRRAFEMERQQLATGQKEAGSLIVASVDVNDLKFTNDTMGHAAGDFLIRSAANVLSDLTEDYGSVFRTGGDEFLLVVYDMDPAEFEARQDRLWYEIRMINSNSETKLSLALGFETCSPDRLDQALQSADQKMYANKASYKARKARKLTGEDPDQPEKK